MSGSRAVLVVRVRHCLSVLVYAGLSIVYCCQALPVTGCTCIYAYNLAPMQDFEDDDPTQTIIIDHDTDASSDVDDLSEVSMASASGIGKQEFQGLLSDIAAQQMAASLDALASRVEDMSVEQVEEAAVRVASETGHVRGLEEITGVFDKG